MADISKIKVLDGTTYNIKDASALRTGSTFPEAYLIWGGRNLAGSFAPIDAAMVGALGANRLEMISGAAVTVEYSRDGGSTWTDYGASNDDKRKLMSSLGFGFNIGKPDSSHYAIANQDLLRVTIDSGSAGVYTTLNKFIILCSTNGSTGCWCSIDAATHAAQTTFVNFANKVPIAGWSGWNVINTSGITTWGNNDAQYQKLRFTFGATGSASATYKGLGIIKILGFGGVGWSEPNNLAANGHLYSYDVNFNASFPAQITATQFNGSLNGNASTATTAANAQKVNNLTVETAVPANALFTDHTYNFAGVQFNSGNSGTAEHNANNATANGNYYYSSNGPGTDIGASTGDGALYVQSYSGSWVGQIAQDYRNGGLFVRGRNNGTWTAWAKVFDANHKPSASYTPAGTVSTPTITVTPTTASIGSASGWNAGSVPTLGTAIPADDITAWTTNTPSTVPTMAASEGVLTFTAGSNGTAASLSYTAKSIPNVTAVGTKPSLTITSTTVATGIDSATSTKPTFTGTAATITSS